MLYLIKLEITSSTKELVTRLMVHAIAIQCWKGVYLSAGLVGLLNYTIAKHKSNGIIISVISDLIKEQLSSPTSGITSYKALQDWLQENHLPNVSTE